MRFLFSSIVFIFIGNYTLDKDSEQYAHNKTYDKYFFLKEGIYSIEKDEGDTLENYAIVSINKGITKIGFKMYWSPNHEYKIVKKKENELLATYLIDDKEMLFDTLTLKLLSDTSFKVVNATNNRGIDTPYYYDSKYKKRSNTLFSLIFK